MSGGNGAGGGDEAAALADVLQANMRTMRAWVRTALSFVLLGVALAKLVEDPRSDEEGAVFVVLGTLLLVHGILRAVRVQRALRTGTYRPGRGGPLLASVAMAIGVVAVSALILV